MKANLFADAVTASARVFGRKAVSVVFEGTSAHTDGDTIYLPNMPASADITVAQADVIRGYRDHESLHVRCTSTSPATIARLIALEQADKHHGSILQYCEDVRIEHAGVLEYPGMKHSLSALQTQAAKMLLAQIETRGDAAVVTAALPRPMKFRLVLQAIARAHIGVTSDGVFEKLGAHIAATDKPLYDLAEKWAKEMADLPTGFKGNTLYEGVSKKGTAESFALAERIVQAFSALEPPPPPPPPQSQDGEPSDEDQPGQPQDGAAPPEGGQPGDGYGSDGEGTPSGDQPGGGKGSGDSESQEPGDQPDAGDQAGDDDAVQTDQPAPPDQPGQPGDDGPDPQPGGESTDAAPGAGTQAGGEGESGDDAGAGDPGASGGEDSDGAGAEGGDASDAGGGNGSGCGLGVEASKAIERALEDMQANALNQVMEDLSNPAASAVQGRAKGVFMTWSTRFAVKLTMEAAHLATSGHSKGPLPEGIRQQALFSMGKVDKAIGGSRAMIRRVLELELQARNDRRWESGHKRGRLQSVKLVAAIQGNETVYQRRENGKDMDTLLYISIDGSGSMRGEEAYQSIQLSYALSEALERTGCDIIVEMWGNVAMHKGGYRDSPFTNREHTAMQADFLTEVDRRRREALPPKYTSDGTLFRAIIKPKNRRVNDADVRVAFGLAMDAFNSSTPSYHAVFEDLKDLARENHAKKIYLHITDGMADRPSERVSPTEIMKEAHTYAASIGVHMIGVGIDNMKLDHLFPDHIQVAGADAYEPVIRKLAKLVAKEAGHVAGFKRSA